MSSKNTVYRLLSISNDLRAASRGPVPLAKRYVRKSSYRGLSRLLRKAGMW